MRAKPPPSRLPDLGLGDDGTAIATQLGYAPLPSALKDAALQKVALIGS